MLFSMRKKRTLTLLEIIVSMVLLGVLLTGLFNVFYQGLKKSISAKELKQKILQLELFQHRVKTFFSQNPNVWIEKHPQAIGKGLFTCFEQKADYEFEMCGNMQGMLYLNDNKQLCFVSWSEAGKARVETLLDKVEQFKFRLFEAKAGQWVEDWPKNKKGSPVMISIELNWEGKQIPFVFFLNDPSEYITYYSGPT